MSESDSYAHYSLVVAMGESALQGLAWELKNGQEGEEHCLLRNGSTERLLLLLHFGDFKIDMGGFINRAKKLALIESLNPSWKDLYGDLI